MKAVVASDLHLTDQPRAAYRFDVFPFLRTKIKQYHPDALLLLGDLTDFKDKHPADLVNRLVAELVKLANLCPVYLLKGNHDYIEATEPFFLFAKNLRARYPIVYINRPTRLELGGSKVLFLPHTRTPDVDWKGMSFADTNYIFLHQTLNGARSSNGQSMEGASYTIFDDAPGLVMSGDIHVPQKIGNVNYVGSPYHINFGDSFKPRCVSLDGYKITSLRLATLSMHTVNISEPEELAKVKNIKPGDYVKIRIQLTDLDSMNWSSKKQEAITIAEGFDAGEIVVELVDARKGRKSKSDGEASPQARPANSKKIFDGYCQSREIGGSLRKVGQTIVESA
tara:strand:- start:58534 stop:59547 length:1014 start_codon:yes stop_codon:yes gene_type:complete